MMRRYYQATYGGSPDGAIELIRYHCASDEDKARMREQWRKEAEEKRHQEAIEEEELQRKLDAHNPLMTRFTKRVIAALDTRIREVFNSSVSARKAKREQEANRLYWLARDIADIRTHYCERLYHFQGL